MGLAW